MRFKRIIYDKVKKQRQKNFNLMIKLRIQDMNYMNKRNRSFFPLLKKCNVVQFVEL